MVHVLHLRSRSAAANAGRCLCDEPGGRLCRRTPRAVFSCRQRGRPSGQRSDNAVVDAPAEATHLSFSQWREQFRAEALAAGISATTFERAFAGVQPDPAVIEADRSQPEFTRPIWQYLESAISPQRVRSDSAC